MTSSERRDCSLLASCIREAFPQLVFNDAELNDEGGDYRVLLLDRRYAFRFPRRVTDIQRLRKEIAILVQLKRVCSLQTPQYEFIHPKGICAGYRYIDGRQLTPELFGGLSPQGQTAVLRQTAGLLSALHGLAVETVEPREMWSRVWSAAEYADRARHEGLPLIGDRSPELLPHIEAFLCSYERQRPPAERILHGDLVGEHLLVARDASGLSGVIDFSDVGLGDPANDLMWFWSCGRAAVIEILSGYAFSGSDPGLFERSWSAYIRYRIDQYWQGLRDGDEWSGAEIQALRGLVVGGVASPDLE